MSGHSMDKRGGPDRLFFYAWARLDINRSHSSLAGITAGFFPRIPHSILRKTE